MGCLLEVEDPALLEVEDPVLLEVENPVQQVVHPMQVYRDDIPSV
jgi:hypothetical protein